MVNQNDLRVIKTKEAIKETFLSLLAEKSFESISVAQIIRTARISKGTFYYHYLDKYDLAEKILEEELAHYRELIPKRLTLSNNSDEGALDLLTAMQEFLPDLITLMSIKTDTINAEEMIQTLIETAYLDILNQTKLQLRQPLITAKLISQLVLTQIKLLTQSQTTISIEEVQLNLKELSSALTEIFHLK